MVNVDWLQPGANGRAVGTSLPQQTGVTSSHRLGICQIAFQNRVTTGIIAFKQVVSNA